MNILLIISAYRLPYANGQYYYMEGLAHLDRYRPYGNITFCCPIVDKNESKRPVDLSDIRISPIHTINTVRSLIFDMPKNKKVIRKEVTKADAIIAYVPSRVAYYAQKVAKQQGKPCLLTAIGCPWDGMWNHSWRGKFMAPWEYFAMKRAMRKADYAIYVTQKFLQKRYPVAVGNSNAVGISDVILEENHVGVIEKRMAKIEAFNPEKEIKIATCAAIYVRYKRQEDVIKAIARLKNEYNIHYYMAGKGDSSYLQSIANKYGVGDRVHFVGILTHREIFGFLESMDLYIQPSKQEGLPRSVVEAMSYGLPALGSDVAGIPELLTPECIFKRGNINDIVDHLRFILNKEELKKQAAANFEKSKEFDIEILNERRNAFFKKFFDSCKYTHND